MTDTSVTYELQSGESLKGDCAWYEVERRLGQGGRGETFLAKITRVTDAGGRSGAARLEVGMRVVIKTPRLERDRDYFQLRFFVGAVNTALDEELAALEPGPPAARAAVHRAGIHRGNTSPSLPGSEIRQAAR